MKLSEIPRMFSPTTWIVGAIVAASLILAAWWLVIGGPAHDRRMAAQSRADAALSQSRAQSAGVASVLLDHAHQQAAEAEALARESADAIHAAPGADVRLDRDLNRAARERLCLRPAYRGRPECLQHADRAKPSG